MVPTDRVIKFIHYTCIDGIAGRMKTLTEDEIIEQLDEQEQLLNWLQKANEILFSAVKTYLPQVFVNNDPDILEYAVKPLLAKSGPLDNMDVSLRLLYALGKIKKPFMPISSVFHNLASMCRQKIAR